MRIRRILLIGTIGASLVGCGVPTASRPTPPLTVNITPAPTEDISGTKTAFALRTAPTEQPEGLYIIREGDTLESIALAFNTTVDEITMTNKISNANVIYIGQPLIIPSLISSTLPMTDVQDPTKDVTPTP